MFQHCRENQGIPRLGALGSLLVYNSCPAVPCTSSGNISMAFLGLGIINFECLALLWSGKVFSRKAAGHSELCWAPESLYQESLIQIFFLCENTLCCQWEWRSCVDDFWCREFCEVQPWALSSFRLLKLLCGKKKKTNQNPQFRYFVFPITQCPRYLI